MNPTTTSTYPGSLSLLVVQAGHLDQTLWRQDLLFGDLLIRSTERGNPVKPAVGVAVGQTAVLDTSDRWHEAIPLIVR